MNDTWCSNRSWKPISASWECVFVHKPWVGACLQANVIFWQQHLHGAQQFSSWKSSVFLTISSQCKKKKNISVCCLKQSKTLNPQNQKEAEEANTLEIQSNFTKTNKLKLFLLRLIKSHSHIRLVKTRTYSSAALPGSLSKYKQVWQMA